MGMLSATWRRFFCALLVATLVLGNVVLTASTANAAGGISGSVSGTIVDESKNPVPGVEITVASPSGTYHGRSDAKGQFAILGVLADTYVISLQKTGYQTSTLSGVTVTGDNALTLGNIVIGRQIIGRTRARSANSAYQPNQTIDSTTLSGARVQQALGSPVNTNEQQLILAAPGTALSSSGSITIRGSTSVEIGYQYDGVNFSSPYYDANGSNGYIINLTGGVGGSLQVVSGSGDATQGNVGAGVINIVPPRGTYPATGDLAADIAGPSFKHQIDTDFAIASPNGRFSDYVSYDGQRYVPDYYPTNVPAANLGEYGGTSYVAHNDVQNNFVYRFGKDNDQSLQVLYRTSDDQTYGDYGGLAQAQYYYANPFGNELLGFATGLGYPGTTAQQINTLFNPLPGIPSGNPANPQQAEETGTLPLHFLKVGYTRDFGASTFLSADYYDWGSESEGTNYTTGSYTPGISFTGGSRVGFGATLTHQFGTNHTVSLEGSYENSFPTNSYQSPAYAIFGLAFYFPGYGTANGQLTPDLSYWGLPTACSTPTPGAGCGQPISGANQCAAAGNDPCYIYNQLVAKGLWKGIASMPTIPTPYTNMQDADFQFWGVGIRDQWTVTPKLKLDYGLREDGAQYKFACNTFAANPCGNPSDLSPNLLEPGFLTPRTIQPRFALSYAIDPNNSVRFSYGRSTEYAFAQQAGTPFGLYNLNPVLNSIAPTDTAAAPGCGSGYAKGAGYSNNPNIPFSPGGGYLTGLLPNGNTNNQYFKCTSLAQQLFWAYDQQLDAPDYGGQNQPNFSNYDIAYSHQFTKGALSGFGMKLTGFGRRGFDIEEDILLANGPPSPLTGQSSGNVYTTKPDGEEKTAGLEFMLTTPDRPVGFSGFLSATYISEFQSQPPVASGAFASDNLPGLVQENVLQTGVLFRAGYVAPFQARSGITYKTKSGLTVTPILSGTTGYPYGVGASTVGVINGTLGFVPQTNYGEGAPLAGPNGPGNAYNATSYVDPANPGSYVNPNIAATRGYSEPALAGNHLTNPTSNLDLSLEQKISKRLSFGIYLSNLWNVQNGLPYQNTKWQPVATGVGGPMTGQNSVNANPNSPDYANYVAGGRDQYVGGGGYLPFSYQVQAPRHIDIYLQQKL